MARLSISQLPIPAKRYSPDTALPCIYTGRRFETLREARAEDLTRAARIRRACRAADIPFDQYQALELAERLQQSGDGLAESETIASMVYMGRMRLRIGGALWKWADLQPDMSSITLIRRGLIFSAAELADCDPTQLINSYRSALIRCGAGGGEGQLFAGIHGEFNPTTHQFHVHLHGLASGNMIDAVDSLRDLPNYLRGTIPGDKQPRVVISRQPLHNLPYPLIYTVQPFWPLRWRGLIDGELRHGKRQRIPEPYHTILLLWLDRWSLNDITLMMGMFVGREGLTPSNPYINGRYN